jgi:hypothetical protein
MERPAVRRELPLLLELSALVPPLALETAGVLAGLAGPRARRAAHLATVAGSWPPWRCRWAST